MTILGKILTILLFIMILVATSFIIMFHSTHTNWRVQYEKLESQYNAVNAARSNYVEEVKRTQEDRSASVTEERKRVDVEIAKRKEIEKQLVDAQIATADIRQERDKLQIEKNKAQEEVLRRKQEVDELVKDKEKLLTQVSDVTKLYVDAKQESVNLGIQRQSLIERVKNLAASLQEKERLLDSKSRANVIASKDGTVPNNPPPEDVEGVVTQVEGALVELSIGSDSGLSKGHTLEVYRPDLQRPANGLYLGTIRIVEVRAKVAVGQADRALGAIKVNDRVAANLTRK